MGIKGMNASYEKRLRHHVEISVVDANTSTVDFCEWRLTNIPHGLYPCFSRVKYFLRTEKILLP
jgi:hypothetical protein